jgi:branched-chain amino acid transport system ATP-binding protein
VALARAASIIVRVNNEGKVAFVEKRVPGKSRGKPDQTWHLELVMKPIEPGSVGSVRKFGSRPTHSPKDYTVSRQKQNRDTAGGLPEPRLMSNEYILETRDLVKEFKGFVAVNAVSLKVRRGDIHALIGPNGAGKTTFFNLLTKFLLPTAGTILYRGKDITGASPANVARRGLVRSFQISSTFPHMTVLENVRVALQRGLGNSFHFWRSERTLSHLDARVHEILESVELAGHAQRMAVELPYGQKRALELATTLALEPELMLLDEPTQGMGHEDVSKVTQLIKNVSAKRTVLMVEHNMSVVASIADRISVLQRGSVIAEGPYDEVSKNPQVIEAYMGTADSALQGAH